MGDSDPTVRSYATEFLVTLSDARASSLAVKRAASAKDDNARYNWLLVAASAWPKISAAEKKTLSPHVQQARQASGTKTRPLIDKLE